MINKTLIIKNLKFIKQINKNNVINTPKFYKIKKK